ncbi:DUF6234 family protein [Streptomyces sp. NPDC001663]|uniref:DUF6234 family protein n=1 Tax=Streptomyces sp. NPDC001663 TaxID=3364597 RepID=UPI00369C0526
MSHAPSAPASPRSRPWSSRTSRGSDIAAGIGLFIGETVLFLWLAFGYGMEVWAAQGEQTRIDAAQRAELAMTQHFLLAVLALAGLALLSRARWTATLQLLAAAILAVLLADSQHAH